MCNYTNIGYLEQYPSVFDENKRNYAYALNLRFPALLPIFVISYPIFTKPVSIVFLAPNTYYLTKKNKIGLQFQKICILPI
mgnify:CR=1 FL=1